MTWFERLALRLAIDRITDKLRGAGMLAKAATVALVLTAIGAILNGAGCFFEHLSAGDLSKNYQECIAMIMGGVGMISPGLHALKIGPFARPGE